MLVKAKEGLVLHEISEDAYIILDPNEGKYFKLNRTAKEIFDSLKGNEIEMETIVDEMQAKYNIPSDLIKKDIFEFINLLLEKGFIISDEFVVKNENEKIEDKEGLRTLWLKVTNKCNLKCPYCYADSKIENDSTSELNIDEIEMIFKELKEMGLEKIVITGGEPLLRKDIVEILKRAKNYGQLQLLTNGVIFNQDILDEIVKYVDIIQFSIDSYDGQKHNQIRGKGNFEKTMRTVKYIQGLGFKNVVFAVTPTPANDVDLVKMIDFCIENKVRRLHVNRYVPLGRARDYEKFDIEKFYRKADEAYAHIHELYKNAIKRREKFDFSIDIAGDFVNSVYSKGKKYSCGLNKSIISVEANGDVYLCQAMHDENLKLGNIRVQRIKDIQKKVNKDFGCFCVDCIGKCKDCDVRYWCGAGCRALAYAVNGSIFENEPQCDSHRKRILDLMGRIQ